MDAAVLEGRYPTDERHIIIRSVIYLKYLKR